MLGWSLGKYCIHAGGETAFVWIRSLINLILFISETSAYCSADIKGGGVALPIYGC